MGAWIEIYGGMSGRDIMALVAPFMGAWIEITFEVLDIFEV